jgi:hypothetical protein
MVPTWPPCLCLWILLGMIANQEYIALYKLNKLLYYYYYYIHYLGVFWTLNIYVNWCFLFTGLSATIKTDVKYFHCFSFAYVCCCCSVTRPFPLLLFHVKNKLCRTEPCFNRILGPPSVTSKSISLFSLFYFPLFSVVAHSFMYFRLMYSVF